MSKTLNSPFVRLPGTGSVLRQTTEVAADAYWYQRTCQNLNYSIAAKTPPALLSYYHPTGAYWEETGGTYEMASRGWGILWRPCDELEIRSKIKADGVHDAYLRVDVSPLGYTNLAGGAIGPHAMQSIVTSAEMSINSAVTTFTAVSDTISGFDINKDRTLYVSVWLKYAAMQSVLVFGRAYD